MPELPEVESVRRMLSPDIIGRTVTSVEVINPVIVRHGDLSSLVGIRIERIDRYGKYLKFMTNTNITLFIHFGMSGVLRWNHDSVHVLTHVRAVINFDNSALIYDDVRMLKGLFLYDNDMLPWKKLGIDALDPDFTPKLLTKLLINRRRAIKLALLDQAVIAGIGNIYASEILFASSINPFREAGSLNDTEIFNLHSAIISILNAAIEANGTTLRDYKLSNGKDGSFQGFLQVYGKNESSCPRCNSKMKIMKIKQAQRSTYYCQNSLCQK